MTALVVVRCENPACINVLRGRIRPIVGELSPGSLGRLKCHECGTIALYRIPMLSGVVDRAEVAHIQ